ncbi:MAG: oxaloacetate decarboxylase [Haloarculaceae archaeon]
MADNTSRLRDLLDRDEILLCPGVHDPLSAAVADAIGFDALYMTGYGTALSKTGYPDAGLVTMPEMIENANNVQERIDVPLIADCDNGYGGVANVIRSVREYVKTGVAAIHIEDQGFPKRCGHTAGRELVPVEEAAGKIAAACDVRDERAEDFVIIARTDARGAVDGSLEEALERMEAYLDAGADVAFVEGPTDEAEVERVAERIDAPLLYNFVGDLGTSPYVEIDTLERLGYDLVIFPVLSTLATITGVYEHLERFADDPLAGVRALDDAFDEVPVGSLHDFSGFPDVVEWEREYLPAAEQEKYARSLGDDVSGDAE